LRKQADLDVSDRIKLFVKTTPGLKKAIKEYSDYIMAETLTVELKYAASPRGASVTEDEFDGETLNIGLLKA